MNEICRIRRNSIFLKVGPFKEDIFLTTFYGLYFIHHYTYYKLQSFSHVGPLWAAFMCGYSSCLYFCFNVTLNLIMTPWIRGCLLHLLPACLLLLLRPFLSSLSLYRLHSSSFLGALPTLQCIQMQFRKSL